MKARKMGILLLTLSFLIIITCKQTENIIPLNPNASLVSYHGCKTFAQESGADGQLSLSHAQNKDCVEYQYYGDSILELHHINAGFNCCPGEIVADIDINDNVIIIRENETDSGCFCLCLFDVNYKIEGLMPGIYTIIFIEPYANDQDEKLEFTVNLNRATSGTYCVSRDHYPW